MCEREIGLPEHLQPLARIQDTVRSVCQAVGIDVDKIEKLPGTLSRPLLLPWHEAASPTTCLANTRQILRHPPEVGADLEEFSESLDFDLADGTYLGLIGAVEVVRNQFWEPSAKKAFLSACADLVPCDFKIYHLFTLKIDSERTGLGPEHLLDGMLCWAVQNLLAANALMQDPVSGANCPSVVRVLMDSVPAGLANLLRGFGKLASGTDVSLARVERTLFKLGVLYPVVGPEITTMLATIQSCLEEPLHFEYSLVDNLEQLYPDPMPSLDLSGDRIAREASSQTETIKATFALLQLLKDRLMQAPEWSAPLECAARMVCANQRLALTFNDCDLVSNRRAQEALLKILSQAPGVKVVFEADMFFDRQSDDPSYAALAKELNLFVIKDQVSAVISRVSQPNFEARKAQCLALLREVATTVGSKNVKIVAPGVNPFTSETATCLIRGPMNFHNALSEPDPFTIGISLKKREADEQAVADLKSWWVKYDTMHLPPTLLYSPAAVAIDECVIPMIAQQHGSGDQYGLCGYSPADGIAALSNVNITGIGQFPIIKAKNVLLLTSSPHLAIIYAGQHEDQEQDDPIDTAENPNESRSGSNDLVRSK